MSQEIGDSIRGFGASRYRHIKVLYYSSESNPRTAVGRPLGLPVKALRISIQSAHEGGKVVSLKHRPTLPPRQNIWHSFLLEAEPILGPYRSNRDSYPRPSAFGALLEDYRYDDKCVGNCGRWLRDNCMEYGADTMFV